MSKKSLRFRVSGFELKARLFDWGMKQEEEDARWNHENQTLNAKLKTKFELETVFNRGGT